METDHHSIDWEEIYLCLYSFTHKLLKTKHWFRKSLDGSSIKGKQVHDYVSDGLERYFMSPEKHDPSKGSLTDYLKFNIIRTLVGNDSTSAENEKSVDMVLGESEHEELYSTYSELLLPFTEALFDEQLDYDLIMNYVEEQAKGDSIVEEMLVGMDMGLKRREIIKEFDMSSQDYDNGMKRLNTILKNTSNKFNLEKAKP